MKFKKNKLKEKLAKKLHASPTNKILKKKLKVDKKVTFHKETLLKESVKSDSLVKNVKPKSDILKKPSQNADSNGKTSEDKSKKPKQKSIEKKQKRQKTQVYDTKLILSLMKEKFNENEERGNLRKPV